MKTYVIFGNHSEKVTRYLASEFTITGFERTLDAVTASVDNMEEKPDVFLVLGSALVTGITEGSMNYGKVLLENLKSLRLACPKTRIKLILSNKANDEIIKGVIALGIYDVYKVDKLNIESLPEIIRTEKNISDYSKEIPLPKTSSGSPLKENKVAVVDPEVDYTPNSNFFNRIGKFVGQVLKKEDDLEEVFEEASEKTPNSNAEQKIEKNLSVLFNLTADVVCVGQKDIPKALRYIRRNRDKPIVILDANNGLLASELVKLSWETDWRAGEDATPGMFGSVEVYGVECDRKIPLKDKDIDTLLWFTETALESGNKVFISMNTEEPEAIEVYKEVRRITPQVKTKPVAVPVQEAVVCQPVSESNFIALTRAVGIVLMVVVSLVLTGAALYLLHLMFTMVGIESPLLDKVSTFIRDLILAFIKH